MDEKKSLKKASKKRRPKISPETVPTDSDDLDNVAPDLNGINVTLPDGHSLSSDGGWSKDDDRKLVQKVKSTSKPTDHVNYKTRLKQVKWDDIAFKKYSADECEKRFQALLKSVRRHRNLNEIAEDIETNIEKCPLKKPSNSYQLFIQDQLTNVKTSGDFSETMKNLATLYKELPFEKRAVYERKAAKLRVEYKQKKAEFDSGKVAPAANVKAKTPFMLYAESRKSVESDFNVLKHDYANLPFDERYKWVGKCVSQFQDKSKEGVANILTKEEKRILQGKIKSTPTAYSLFVKESYAKIKDELQDEPKKVFTEIAVRWKSLEPHMKKHYLDAAALLKEKALKMQESFNERQGLTPQRKRRKSTYVEQPPEIESDDEEATEAAPVSKKKKKKKKKKKTSISKSGSDEASTKQIQFEFPKQKKGKQKSEEKPKSLAKLSTPTKQNSPTKLSSPKPNAVPEFKSPAEVVQDEGPEQEREQPESARKKKKSQSESSEYNEISGRDPAHSSSSTGSKEPKVWEVVGPPKVPPTTFYKYFVQHIHTGDPNRAQRAFDRLPKRQRKELKAEYNEILNVFELRMKKYLATLSKSDALTHLTKIQEAQAAEEREEAKQSGEDGSQAH